MLAYNEIDFDEIVRKFAQNVRDLVPPHQGNLPQSQ